MKHCSKCGQTYDDDSLNFCLNDGNALSSGSASEANTAVFTSAGVDVRPTEQVNYAPTQAASGAGMMQPQAPQKKSRAWVWVLLILGAVVLLCGGGIGALLFIGSRAQPSTSNVSITIPTPSKPSTPDGDDTPSFSPPSGDYVLTMEKYNQIKDGTTRADAEKILGGPGNEMSSTSVMGTTYATVKWDGPGFSSVILSFKNDKVYSRVQVGLK